MEKKNYGRDLLFLRLRVKGHGLNCSSLKITDSINYSASQNEKKNQKITGGSC